MKNKAKLWLLATGVLSAAGVPALLAASCKVVENTEENRFVVEYNSELTSQPFRWDSSRSYGGYVDGSETYLTGGELFRIKALEPAKISSILINDKIESLVVKPTVAKYQLGLAKAVVVTLNDGTVKIFDNDDAQVVIPEGDLEISDSLGNKIKYFSNPNLYIKSSNEKSINSNAFFEALDKAKKLQVVIKDDVKWVNNNGEATKYNVVAKDFYYSWLRTTQINENARHGDGGSKKLDELFKKVISKSDNNVFTDKENYGNEYLFKVFGIDSSKFYNESDFITNIASDVPQYANSQALTFNGIDGATPKYKEFAISTLLGRDMTFMPAPSQFIDEMNKAKTQPLFTENDDKVVGAEEQEYLKLLNSLPADSKAFVSGAYWYGTSVKSTLFSGAYYGKGRKGSGESIQKNLHSWDKEFVARKNSIDIITKLYQQRAVDAKEFSNTIFLKYQQGTLSQISYTQLSDAQKKEVATQPAEFGYRLVKKLNAKNPYYFVVSNPFVNNRATAKYNYAFNDAYAHLVYGTSIQDLKADKQNRDEYIHGLGLSFRTILNAAINWDVITGEMTGGIAKSWLAKVADGSSIGGKDQNTSQYKNPADVDDKVNALSAVDKDGNLINFGTLGNELNPSENALANKDKADLNEKLKSAGWETLKAKMQELLDAFDKKYPNLAGQDIVFQYVFPYANAPEKYLAAYDKFEFVVSALNPRLKASVKKFTNLADPKVKEEFNAWRNDGIAPMKLISWSYDYNSIGSGYDGLSWLGNFFPTLINLSRLEESSNFATSFPKLFALAKDLIKYEESHPFVSSIPFKELDKASGYYYTRGLHRYFDYKMKKNTNGLYELDLKTVTTTKEVEENGQKVTKEESTEILQEYDPGEGKHTTDPFEWSSIFWLNYVSSQTNEFLIGLMQEIATYLNVDFTYGITRSKEDFLKELINKNYITPSLSGADATPYQDWSIKK